MFFVSFGRSRLHQEASCSYLIVVWFDGISIGLHLSGVQAVYRDVMVLG